MKKIAVLALVVCIIAGMFLIRRSRNENTYAEAVQMMQSGDYEGAVSAFKALGGYKDSRDLLTSIRADYEISQCADAQVGDTVLFGTYEQDDKTNNGSEDIEWFVLAKEEDRVLLLSRYALEGQPFNADSTDTTWETCSLRKWLNSDFLTTAFDQNEQQKIAETVCKAETSDFVSDDEIENLSITDCSEIWRLNSWFISHAGKDEEEEIKEDADEEEPVEEEVVEEKDEWEEDGDDCGTKKERMDSAISRSVRNHMIMGNIGRQVGLKNLEMKDIRDAKIAIIKKVRPDMRLDGKSDAYINGAFESARKTIKASKTKDTSYQKRQMFNKDSRDEKVEKNSAEDARERMIARMYKK